MASEFSELKNWKALVEIFGWLSDNHLDAKLVIRIDLTCLIGDEEG